MLRQFLIPVLVVCGFGITPGAGAEDDESKWVYFRLSPEQALERGADRCERLDQLTLAATIGSTKTVPSVGARSPSDAVLVQRPHNQTLVGRYKFGTKFDGWVYRLLATEGETATEPAQGVDKLSLTWYRIPIQASGDDNDPEAERMYWQAIIDNSRGLMSQGYTGGAWFRYQQRQAIDHLHRIGASVDNRSLDSQWNSLRLSTMALLSGGRAVAENLPLSESAIDDDGPALGEGNELVPIGDEPGVSVAAITWAIDKTQRTSKDYAAKLIPHDQHVVFLPDGPAALALKNDFNRMGAAAIATIQRSATSADVWQRYERQIGIPVDRHATGLVSPLVLQIALTGSDPYFQTGTDFAAILVSRSPTILKSLVLARRATVLESMPEKSEIINGIDCSVIRSADRSISSYVARIGNCVIVSNSPAQIRAIADVVDGKRPALVDQDEYTWFRQRYQRSQNETALLLISDPTIRRWCSPRWRVGSARRTWAAAVLARQAIENALGDTADVRDEKADGKADPADWSNLALGKQFPASVDPTAITRIGAGLDAKFIHNVYGSLEFMTPIAELEIDSWTIAERDQYRQWLQRFERRYRKQFDPIGLRLYKDGLRWHPDLTVLPLSSATQYGFLRMLAGETRIFPRDLDTHPQAVLHAGIAIDPQSVYLRLLQSSIQPKEDVRELFGSIASIYFDLTPQWFAEAAADYAKGVDVQQIIKDAPMGVRIAVKDRQAMADALDWYFESRGANALGFESRKHHDYRDYDLVKVDNGRGAPDVFYYVILPDAITISADRSLVARSIDRYIDRPDADENRDQQATGDNTAGDGETDSLGYSLIGKLTSDGIHFAGYADDQHELRTLSWRNLPILDALKKEFPDRDPAQMYEKFSGRLLVCPAGGQYHWNARYRCHESSVFGHPMLARGEPIAEGQPSVFPKVLPPSIAAIKSLEFRIRLELDGLRSQGLIEFKEPQEQSSNVTEK